MYQNDAQKCLTGEVRLSYVNLNQPRQINGQGEPKYSVTLLIPKSDANTLNDIQRAIQAAVEYGVSHTWNGKKPPQPRTPLYDGDGVKADGTEWGEECKGHWVLRCTSSKDRKPQCVGIDNIHVELDPRDVYSGMYARATIRFFPYAAAGNIGIGCGIGNVLKLRDGEALSGSGASAASDFAELATQYAAEAAQNQTVQINPLTGLPM